MNKKLVTLMVAALALLSARGQVAFTGVGEHHVIEVTPETTTGLNKIYVVFDTDGVGMTFTSSTGEPATWESFDYRDGNLVMEPIPGIRWNGMETTLPQVIPNTGYKIVEGTTPYFCWVVNYADYYLELNAMTTNNEAPCNLLTINVDGQGGAIPYYGINGLRQVLDREIKLNYNTLVWDETDSIWVETPVAESFAALDQALEIVPPLCNTAFVITGDRFLEEWGEGTSADGDYYYTQAVACQSVAVQKGVENNPEDAGANEPISAPAEFVFTGYPTDAVVYRVWQMATDPEFEDVFLQWNQDEVNYTFMDAGSYYMRYMVANAAGTCEDYGEVFQINVSESQLGKGAEGKIPNVFSPGSTEGVNDVWKVAYKSLVEFHCWIFNRWGTLVYEYTDPDGGWDGTYQGKLVDPGVFYYVITALGSDGVKYKRRGDITIIRYKRGAASGGGTGGY